MKFRYLNKVVLAFMAFLFSTTMVCAVESKGVVVTIKPLHSLVSGVVGDTGKTHLLITGNSSPHGFQIKPSQMETLSNAKIVFYISDDFETFLKGPFDAIPSQVVKSSVVKEARLRILPFRKGALWEEDQHEGHNHSSQEGAFIGDMHVWLDPNNAIKMIKAITRELSEVYPKNRNVYKVNAREYIQKILSLDSELTGSLAPLKDNPFIVLHDGYQYFERNYDLNGIGSIQFDPNNYSSPKRIKEIRNKLKTNSAMCVFREPQFSDRLVKTVVEGTSARTGLLDPLGSTIDDGPKQYFKLLRNMANSFKQCFNS